MSGEFKNINPQLSEGAIKVQLRVILQMAGLPFQREGYLEAFIDTDKGTLRAGRLQIKSQPPQAASVPTSAESAIYATELSPPATQSPAARKPKAKKRAPSRP